MNRNVFRINREVNQTHGRTSSFDFLNVVKYSLNRSTNIENSARFSTNKFCINSCWKFCSVKFIIAYNRNCCSWQRNFWFIVLQIQIIKILIKPKFDSNGCRFSFCKQISCGVINSNNSVLHIVNCQWLASNLKHFITIIECCNKPYTTCWSKRTWNIQPEIEQPISSLVSLCKIYPYSIWNDCCCTWVNIISIQRVVNQFWEANASSSTTSNFISQCEVCHLCILRSHRHRHNCIRSWWNCVHNLTWRCEIKNWISDLSSLHSIDRNWEIFNLLSFNFKFNFSQISCIFYLTGSIQIQFQIWIIFSNQMFCILAYSNKNVISVLNNSSIFNRWNFRPRNFQSQIAVNVKSHPVFFCRSRNFHFTIIQWEDKSIALFICFHNNIKGCIFRWANNQIVCICNFKFLCTIVNSCIKCPWYFVIDCSCIVFISFFFWKTVMWKVCVNRCSIVVDMFLKSSNHDWVTASCHANKIFSFLIIQIRIFNCEIIFV